jgi:hypothetical protein
MSSGRGNISIETCRYPSNQQLLLFHHHEAATPRAIEVDDRSTPSFSDALESLFLSSLLSEPEVALPNGVRRTAEDLNDQRVGILTIGFPEPWTVAVKEA